VLFRCCASSPASCHAQYSLASMLYLQQVITRGCHCTGIMAVTAMEVAPFMQAWCEGAWVRLMQAMDMVHHSTCPTFSITTCTFTHKPCDGLRLKPFSQGTDDVAFQWSTEAAMSWSVAAPLHSVRRASDVPKPTSGSNVAEGTLRQPASARCSDRHLTQVSNKCLIRYKDVLNGTRPPGQPRQSEASNCFNAYLTRRTADVHPHNASERASAQCTLKACLIGC
jgi:hypothetical protein